MSINDRVKQVRVALNLTQKKMGQRLTLAQTYLSQIEKGDRDVTDKIFKIICLELNVREDWLRTGKGSMFNENDETVISDIATQYKLEELDKEILKIFLGLSPEKRDAFKNFAFALVDSVLNNETLYMAYRNQYIENKTCSFAACSDDTMNLDEAAELLDGVDIGKEGE